MEVIMIRHTAVDVPPGTCYGQTDVPLKETFTEEAAQVLSNLQLKGPFDKIYTSPLTRCTRLADYCGYPNAQRDDRLKEIHFGEWEMQEFAQINDPRLEKWYNDYLNVPAPGGESFVMQLQRVSAFLEEAKQSGDAKIAIFAHGGVLICAQIYAGVIEMNEAFDKLSPYGGIVSFDI